MNLVAASAAAQSAAQSSTNENGSALRTTLIGLGVGAAVGGGVGWMRSDFHKAECATLACDHKLEAKSLTPIGAAAGAAIGFLLHHSRQGGQPAPSRTTNVLLTTSYSPARRAIFMRAEF
jgi:hypothetical protein